MIKSIDDKKEKRGGESYLLCVAIIGYHSSAKKALLKAVYPDFELSGTTLDGIFSLSSFSGNEPGFVSLEVDEGIVMSYYTGALEPLRCAPHCLVLFLDKPDKPERYRNILTKMGSVVFPLLCDRDFREFARKLFEATMLTGELKTRMFNEYEH
jgi:hypothetical protein